jgi:membrane protein DedA with SNARE-associated domain
MERVRVIEAFWAAVHGSAALVGQNPELAILVAFVASIVEAVAVLGVLLPGTPILMAIAGAAAISGMSVVPILLAAILGAVIGDAVSFWLGQRFSTRLRRSWPFSRRPDLLVQAERFFQRYGMASVAICRFLPVLRSTVPLVAGMVGMPRCRFLFANVLSACIWAPVHVFPAQFAGLSLDRLESGDWQPAAICAAAFVLLSLGGWLLHRAVKARG